jgi:hypothetical protein
VLRRDRAHFWLWLFLPILLASVLVGVPVSRYRQGLALLLIPWAACFFTHLVDCARTGQFRAAGLMAAGLVVGWSLSLGPLARHPRQQYERPTEYEIAIYVYEKLGDQAKANATRELIRQKFPNYKP